MIILTGASDGIGAAAARLLAREGREFVVVGRSPDKTRAIAEEVGARAFTADFARLSDVRRLASDLLDACPRIDALANNAGGIFAGREMTADGFEKTFQVNHLAPFLLTRLLLARLIDSRASVVQTSSIGSRLGGRIRLDDLQTEHRYTNYRAYTAAKLANILFTRELHTRHHEDGLSAVAFHPGNIASNFAGESRGWVRFVAENPLTRSLLDSPESGARHLVRFVTGRPGHDWEPGGYYEKGRLARRENPQGRDAGLGRALWERSERMLNLTAAGRPSSEPVS